MGCDDATGPLDEGRYELVSVDGAPVPTATVDSGFIVLRDDGTYTWELEKVGDIQEIGSFRVEAGTVTFVPERGRSAYLTNGTFWVADIDQGAIIGRDDQFRPGVERYERR